MSTMTVREIADMLKTGWTVDEIEDLDEERAGYLASPEYREEVAEIREWEAMNEAAAWAPYGGRREYNDAGEPM